MKAENGDFSLRFVDSKSDRPSKTFHDVTRTKRPTQNTRDVIRPGSGDVDVGPNRVDDFVGSSGGPVRRGRRATRQRTFGDVGGLRSVSGDANVPGANVKQLFRVVIYECS